QVEPLGVRLGDRHADQAAAELRHEVDLVSGDELGGEDQVALVLAVFVVDEHGHAAGLQLGDDFGNRIEAHGSARFTSGILLLTAPGRARKTAYCSPPPCSSLSIFSRMRAPLPD